MNEVFRNKNLFKKEDERLCWEIVIFTQNKRVDKFVHSDKLSKDSKIRVQGEFNYHEMEAILK